MSLEDYCGFWISGSSFVAWDFAVEEFAEAAYLGGGYGDGFSGNGGGGGSGSGCGFLETIFLTTGNHRSLGDITDFREG